ncbi:MAG: paraquat-inducible protein A [Verrucomicrobium sp.]|nr:paraquat-inducible protein A [Verrucomicrobium sp.]
MKRHHPWLSWPQVRDAPMQVACHFCDTLQASPRLREGDAAYCCACGERLYRNRPRSLAHATGFSAAALIFMVLAHAFPFLTMSSGSISTKLTLLESARVLVRDGDPLVALGVIFFTVVSPFVLVGGMLYVAAPLRHGIALPGALKVTRWLQLIEPWSMLEVFLLGLIVSLLKLGKLADLDFGLGLWALAALVLCTAAAVGGIDRLELWDRLEITQKEQNEEAQT